MSPWLPIKSLFADSNQVGQSVTVKGWLRSKRDSKAGISFLAVHDGTCFDAIQAVVPNTLTNYDEEVLQLATGCAVEVTGQLVVSEGKGQAVEIQATAVTVIGWVDDPESYPIAKKRHTFEYLRTQAHLRTRTNTFGAITRVRHVLARAIHEYFHRQDFYWVNTPIITASDCEGAGELFRVSTLDYANLPRNPDGSVDHSQDFFGSEAFLTVSGQLAVESHCLSMSRVYTFGPTFRAENSNTTRHLAEFWMVEPEIAFADLNDNAAKAEGLNSEEIQVRRQKESKPILEELKKFLLDHQDAVPPQSLLGKAISYTLKNWEHLTVYLERGDLEIDNNATERCVKPFSVGRKNWYFKGCVKGANASAAIYSLIETAKSCGLNPYDYLKDVFIRLPQKIAAGESLEDLLPYNWKPQA